MAAGERFDLGILFVHGIGMQRPGETLVQWGDALVQSIRTAADDQVAALVIHADAGADASAELLLRYRDRDERWLIAEGWWADAFPAPSYGELVSWSVRALPWAAALHIASWYWQRTETRGWRRAAAGFVAVVQLLVFLAVSPLMLALLGLTVLLGALPIPQLRSVILATQSALTATIGDSLAFVESPIRAALIRERIRARLARLKLRCDRTIVIAHSQGAAGAFDAFGGIIDPASGRTARHDDVRVAEAPDTLLTFGAGTNQLVSQIRLAGTLPEDFGMNPAFAATFALMVVWGVAGYLTYGMRTGQVSGGQIGLAFAYFFAWVAVFAGAAYGSVRGIESAARWQWVGRHRDRLTVGALTTCFAVGVGGVIPVAERLSLPFGAAAVITATVIILAGALKAILSPQLRDFLSAPVRIPPGVRRWVDIYAAADPVSRGPTRADAESLARAHETGVVCESALITNEGSVLTDHTTYWRNVDGFALRVVRACAQTAGSEWLDALPAAEADIDRRSAWRVRVFCMARITITATWALGAVLLAGRYAWRIAVPFDVPRWLPLPLVQLALYVGACTAGAWLSIRLLHGVWSWWTRREQTANLRQERLDSSLWAPLTSMGLLVWCPVFALLRLTGSYQDEGLGFVFVAALGNALISGFVLQLVLPPPAPPAPRVVISKERSAAGGNVAGV